MPDMTPTVRNVGIIPAAIIEFLQPLISYPLGSRVSKMTQNQKPVICLTIYVDPTVVKQAEFVGGSIGGNLGRKQGEIWASGRPITAEFIFNEDRVSVRIWGGVSGKRHEVLYSNPRLFEILEQIVQEVTQYSNRGL